MEEQNTADSDDKQGAGPLSAQMPPDPGLLNEAMRLQSDSNSPVDSLATICLQDPIILIELLKKANALFFSGGGKPITTAKTAIVRLGSDVLAEIFQDLTTREQIADPQVKKWFNKYRSRSRRIGIVSRIFSQTVIRDLSEDCQTIGSLYSIGDMLAAYHLEGVYTELAEEQSRSSVNYKLANNHRFDVEKMGVTYLQRNGIPEALLFALDREARARESDRAKMKPVCMASMELVDAFDGNKWERFAPGKKLAPKSAIRMLQLNDNQYLKIYERTSEYLFAARMIEEKSKAPAEPQEEVAEKPAPAQHDEELQSEIENLLGGGGEEEEEAAAPEPEGINLKSQTEITEIDENLGGLQDQFALTSAPKNKPARKSKGVEDEQPVEAPQLRTKDGNEFVNSISNLMDEADNSEDLLAGILQMLTDGPFEKAALIVISQDRKHAIVVAARGPIGNGQKIEITDPLSPLAKCFTKVQSFASKPNEASPFGCKSFAVSPVDADHDTPVALYADCGDDGAITFEARRIFRTVVEILNQKLPTLPGGIPVELDSMG